LNSLAQAIKSRSDVNVTISNGDSSTGQGSMSSSSARRMQQTPHLITCLLIGSKTPDISQYGTRRSAQGILLLQPTVAARLKMILQNQLMATLQLALNTNSSKSNVAVAHKRVHRKYSTEGSMTFSSNGTAFRKAEHGPLKQARVNTVCKRSPCKMAFPKVNLLLQQPPKW